MTSGIVSAGFRTTASAALDRIAFYLFLGTLTLSLWLYSGSLPWAHRTLVLLTLLTGVLHITGRVLSNKFTQDNLIVALCAPLLLITIQLCPLPTPILQALASGATSLQQDLHAANPELVPQSQRTLSLVPSATLDSLTSLTAFVLLIIMATAYMRDPKRRLTTIRTLLASAVFMALISVLLSSRSEEALLGLHRPRYGGYLFGPFTNRNHYACYMNLITGLYLGYLSMSWHNPVITMDYRSTDSPLAQRYGRLIGGLAGLLLITASTLMTLSRGGILSLMLVLAVFYWLYTSSATGGRKFSTNLLFVIVTGLVLSSVGWYSITSRLSTLLDPADPSTGTRWEVLGSSLQLLSLSPVTGTGAGTFRHTFSMAQPSEVSGRFLHAHNDWLEGLLETGLVGVFVFLPLILLASLRIRAVLSGGTSSNRRLAAGLCASLAGIMLHSCFDYSLQRFANLSLLAALLGGLFALQNENRPELESPSRRWSLLHVIPGLIALLLIIPTVHRIPDDLAMMRFVARYQAAESQEAWSDRTLADPASDEIENHLLEGTLNPTDMLDASHMLHQWAYNSQHPLIRLRMSELSIRCARFAVMKAPMDIHNWQRLEAISRSLDMIEQAEACREAQASLRLQLLKINRP